MILLTGSSGMIGKNIKEQMCNLICPTHEELDITDADSVKEYLRANKPDKIIHCASNDEDVCLYDNLRMFHNLAESKIPMVTFCTGREIEDRSYKNGEYVFSKYLIKELALNKYTHIHVLQIWGCFGKYERHIRFFTGNMIRVKNGLPILINENRLFSYVYVDDLINVISGIDSYNKHTRFVGYTLSLLDYANILKEVTKSPHKIIVESENYNHSYVGKDDCGIMATPLMTAVSKMWDAFKNNEW